MANAQAKDQSKAMVGKFNLVTNYTCDPKIASAIMKRARKSATWTDVPGHQTHIKSYEKIFNLVLEGKIEEAKAAYKSLRPAASLFGPVMPSEMMWAMRKKVEDSIYTVKIEESPARYQEKIEWMMANNMREPEKGDVRPGVICECMACGTHMATPEPLLQHTCSKCNAGKSKSKSKINVVTITNDIKRFSAGYLTRKGTPTGEAILAKVNELRLQIGMSEISKEKAEKAKTVEDLL